MSTVVMFVHVFPGQQRCQSIRGELRLNPKDSPGFLLWHVRLRWQRDIAHVRQLPPATDLRRLFFHRVDRLVRRDSTFLLKNRFFEAPSHLAGKRIEVRFDPLDLTRLEIYSEGKPEGMARLVDAVLNGLLPPWETETN